MTMYQPRRRGLERAQVKMTSTTQTNHHWNNGKSVKAGRLAPSRAPSRIRDHDHTCHRRQNFDYPGR